MSVASELILCLGVKVKMDYVRYVEVLLGIITQSDIINAAHSTSLVVQRAFDWHVHSA